VNELGTGFAATTPGAELLFLRRLFTEEEAETYMHLTDRLQSAEQIAQREGLDAAPLTAMLEPMAARGLVFPLLDACGDRRKSRGGRAAHQPARQQLA
jgi:hypothetical protein